MEDNTFCSTCGVRKGLKEENYGIVNPVFDDTTEQQVTHGEFNVQEFHTTQRDDTDEEPAIDTTRRKRRDDKETETKDVSIVFETKSPLIYKISGNPPFYLTAFFAFQQCLLSIAGSLIVPQLVAEAVCAENDDEFIRNMLSSTMLMSGMATFMQSCFGIRLPLYQGPSSGYIIPLIALRDLDDRRCSLEHHFSFNKESWANATVEERQQELVSVRTRELMGPLVLCGGLHCLIGLTGLVGVFMRFIGPITIVPTILLVGLYLVKPTMKYAGAHWGITVITWSVGVLLSLYIGHRSLPIPAYSRRKGFHFIRYPLHQVFAILIAIIIGWTASAVLTEYGALTDDRNSTQYKARTDAREDIIDRSSWFYIPYPGQFGSPLFSYSALIGFLIATFVSILDSIGDYYAAAAMCRVPPPPRHGINRGIAVEGFCSMVSGFYGTGHATTTYGGNIGAIGMTKVASRSVFMITALIYMVLAVLSKLSAVFISMPYPVLGGTIITILGVFIGVNLSNLRGVDLASTRNVSIIGMAVFTGLLIPSWMERHNDAIDTGNADLDRVLTILLGNPNFFGALLACVLDNTIPGTDEERGIASWKKLVTDTTHDKGDATFTEGYEVYEPILPNSIKKHKYMKYCPIFPLYKSS